MKSIFISYNKALSEAVSDILDKQNVRGFSMWENTFGRGSKRGEPHYGTHTWPAVNSSILTIVEDNKVEPLLVKLRELDSLTEQQGLKAYVWNIENML